MDSNYFDTLTAIPKSRNFLLGDTRGALVSILSILRPESYDSQNDLYTYKLDYLHVVVRFDEVENPDQEMSRTAVIRDIY